MGGFTPKTFSALLRAVAAEEPDRVFLHSASERAAADTITFGELERRGLRVAAGLRARGLVAVTGSR